MEISNAVTKHQAGRGKMAQWILPVDADIDIIVYENTTISACRIRINCIIGSHPAVSSIQSLSLSLFDSLHSHSIS